MNNYPEILIAVLVSTMLGSCCTHPIPLRKINIERTKEQFGEEEIQVLQSIQDYDLVLRCKLFEKNDFYGHKKLRTEYLMRIERVLGYREEIPSDQIIRILSPNGQRKGDRLGIVVSPAVDPKEGTYVYGLKKFKEDGISHYYYVKSIYEGSNQAWCRFLKKGMNEK